MRRLSVVAAVAFAFAAAPALGVNDPVVPGDECSASDTAVGHPAFANNQTPAWAANPPFSVNNPGNSTGAQGGANSQATEHCTHAQG